MLVDVGRPRPELCIHAVSELVGQRRFLDVRWIAGTQTHGRGPKSRAAGALENNSLHVSLEERQARCTLEAFDDRVSFVGPQSTVLAGCIGKLRIFRRESQVDPCLREKHDTADGGQGETARGYRQQITHRSADEQTSSYHRVLRSQPFL